MFKKIKKILTFKIGPEINYSKLNPLKFNWGKIKDFAKTGIIVFALVFLILLTVDIVQSDFLDNDDKIANEISNQIVEYLDDNYVFPDVKGNKNCNVSSIMLHGFLTTYIPNEDFDIEGNVIYDETSSENIIHYIEEANKNDSIKAILLEVDSYGGIPSASEEINSAILHSEKPVVVYIRDAGLSAAYYAISGANKIFALDNSNVGSIGVTSSYLDNVHKNEKDGIQFHQLSTGKFKDMLNPDKVLTSEEKELVMRDLNIINDNFIKTVSENRGISVEKVKELADGSSLLGQMALDNKLIDQVGSIYDVKDYIKKLIDADVKVCW